MSSFKAMRELTLLSYAENLLSDDEFLVLWEDNQSKNPDFPWDRYSPFDLENMDEAECKAEFRVEKRDLHKLGEVLEIPPTFRCQQRSVCEGMEGLCVLLRRLAYPCRYSDMIACFGRPVPEPCTITNLVMDFSMTYMATESLSGIPLYSIVGCLKSMLLPSQIKEQPKTTVLASLAGHCGRF